MRIEGEEEIAVPREAVWAALMDPDVLARCIDGVERLERDGERFSGTMKAKVGPVRATFAGSVAMSDLDPPKHFILTGEGKGGVAGFAKGSADITLYELAPERTKLAYAATSEVGGKLAQLGARLIEGTARGYAERFFSALRREVEAGTVGETESPPADATAGVETDPDPVPAPPPETAPSTLGAVDSNEPFRAEGSRGLGPAAWATIVVVVAAGIVFAQFL